MNRTVVGLIISLVVVGLLGGNPRGVQMLILTLLGLAAMVSWLYNRKAPGAC